MKPMVLSLPAAFAVALAFLVWFVHGGLSWLALDHPNHRSLHTNPTPRTGGLALMIGMLVGWSLQHDAPMMQVMAPVLLLMAVSFLDDLRSLSAATRFMTHFLAAGLFLWMAGIHSLGVVVVLLMLPAMVWMTNLYNFMDGSDGLAGGMTLFGFGFYGLAAWMHGDVSFALLNWSITSASLAFLIFNFHPARIFMGDVGSIPLGFLAAALGVLGWQRDIWPLWFPVLVFSPFIVDATVTLCKRLLRGEKVWEAHREHYYQRLVQMGLGHRNTAIFAYALMLGVGGSAVCLLRNDSLSLQVGGLLLWISMFVLLMLGIDRKWARRAG